MTTWAAAVWGLLGAAVGVCVNPLARRLLTSGTRTSFLVAPVVTSSATGVLFGLVSYRFAAWPEVLAYSCLAAVGVVLAVIDMIEHRLPSVLLRVTYPLMLAMFGLASLVQGKETALARAVIGMAVMFGTYFVLAIAARGGFGAGDVKLAGLLGLALAWVGWPAFLAGTLFGFVYGAVTGMILIALGKATRRTAIPFGPAMLAGAFTALIGGVGL